MTRTVVFAVVLASLLVAPTPARSQGLERPPAPACTRCGNDQDIEFAIVEQSGSFDGQYCRPCERALTCSRCKWRIFEPVKIHPVRGKNGAPDRLYRYGTAGKGGRCQKCGAETDAGSAPERPAAASKPPAGVAPPPRRSSAAILPIVLIVGGIAFLVGLAAFLKSQPPAALQRTTERPRTASLDWAANAAKRAPPARAAPPKKARFDPTLGDPVARSLRVALEAGRFEEASQHLDATRDWDAREFYVEALASFDGRPPVLDAWVAAKPQDPAAWLVRGRHSIYWAWEARGGGQASGVSDRAFETFFERLGLADADLAKAAELDPQDPTPHAIRVLAALGLQLGRDEAKRRLDAARARHPWSRLAHDYYLRFVCKKWHGSHEEMFDFARSTSAAAPEGSPLHALVAMAHVERWLFKASFDREPDADSYWRDLAVQSELQSAYARSVGSPTWRDAPAGASARNAFAYCFACAGQTELAARVAERIGEAVTEAPWYFQGEPRSLVRRVAARQPLHG